jgi:hypothetical protein
MAPPHFLLPDDDEEQDYSSENQPPASLSSSEVPKSLLVENEVQLLDFYDKPEIFPNFVDPLHKPKPTKVVKGFGPVELGPPEENTHYDPVPFRGYPPPSNQAYKLTSDGHDPKFVVNKSRPIVTMPSRRHLSFTTAHLDLEAEPKSRLLEVAEATSQRRVSLENKLAIDLSKPKTEGEKAAETIDWNRSSWGAQVPGATTSFYPGLEQRADFIKAIDDIAKTSLQGLRRDYPHLLIPPENDPAISNGPKLEYCKKCFKNHILPGSPITLPDRDTCSAFLPDWFPSQRYVKPWETFRSLYNEIIIYEEMERGFIHGGGRSTKPLWDKEYHDEHPKWRTIGRRHGWWKCRSGPHASEPERTCELCHKPTPKEDPIAAGPGNVPVVDRKKELTDWVDEHMRNIGLEDRALAEEMVRRMSSQQLLGYFPKYNVPKHELEGYETGNDSDPDGERATPERPGLKPTILPNASLATLDLDGKTGKEKEGFAATRSSSVSSCDGLVMRAIAGKSYFAK